MKALTLTQPYATLIAIHAKHIETRSWATSYRGPLAIHAAKGLGPVGGRNGLIDLVGMPVFQEVLVPDAKGGAYWEEIIDAVNAADVLPRGAVIATCELYDCRPTDDEAAPGKQGWSGYVGNKLTYWDLTDQERAFGDYAPNRFAWLLANVTPLPVPIPAKGALGLWEWSP